MPAPGSRPPELKLVLGWRALLGHTTPEVDLEQGSPTARRSGETNSAAGPWKGHVAVAKGELLVEHPSVSRRHALSRVAGGTATLEDCGSKNGTFLRGERIDAPRPLNAGDEICLGQARLHFGVYSPDVSTRSDDRTARPD
jgi:hypothetical protein